MNKVEKLKNKLMLLNDNQLDIIDSLINSWQPKQNNIETSEDTVKKIYENTISPIEDPLKNYSKEELLDEYGVLFWGSRALSLAFTFLLASNSSIKFELGSKRLVN